jgi:S1-C subfamily serine protease
MRSALFALLFLPAGLSAADPRESAVQVTGPGFSGSGTVVSRSAGRSLVLTNRHVCPAAGPGLAIRHNGKAYPAEWVGADPADDLALLSVAADLPAAELAPGLPPKGTTLRQWGYPKAGPQTAKTGAAVGTGRVVDKQAEAELDVWVTDFAPEAGESGSGLFDPDGRLVGVTYARTQDDQCHAVPVGRVRVFLSGMSGKEPAAAVAAGPTPAAGAVDPNAPRPPGPPPGPNFEWRKVPGLGGDFDGYGWVEKAPVMMGGG